MRTKEENMGKEEELPEKKELLSDEELLEVAAGIWNPHWTPSLTYEQCMQECSSSKPKISNCEEICSYCKKSS